MSTTAPITNAADLQFEDGYPYKVTDNPDNKYQRFQHKDVIDALRRAIIYNHSYHYSEADAAVAELCSTTPVHCLSQEGICAIDGADGYWFVDHTSRGVDVDGEDTGSEIFEPDDREALSEFLSNL